MTLHARRWLTPCASHRLSLGPGRHHFFEFTSRSIALSSICSANNFFSRPFSLSSVRNRAASDGSTLGTSLRDTLRAVHTAILRFIFIKCGLADTVTPAKVSRLLASFLLFQHLYDLLVCEPLLHLSVLLVGRTLHQNGGVLGAQVIGDDVNLLNEMRSSAGMLLAAGLYILAGAFRPALAFSAMVVSGTVYLGYGFSRVVSIIFDGVPSSAMLQITALELVIGGICVLLLKFYKSADESSVVRAG